MPDPIPTCAPSTMTLMQKVVNATDKLYDLEIQKIVDFAVGVRDHPDAGFRDKLRACELLNNLMEKGIDVAQYLDKNDRLDSGKSTENIKEDVNYKIAFDE